MIDGVQQKRFMGANDELTLQLKLPLSEYVVEDDKRSTVAMMAVRELRKCLYYGFE